MGAKQRAQKRGKGTPKAAKGSLKGSPLSQKKASSSLHVSSLDPTARSHALLGRQDFAVSSSTSPRNGFSMADQARNTERHTFGWGATKLRDNAISFVSAGVLSQDELRRDPDGEQDAELVQQGPSQIPRQVEQPKPQPALPTPVQALDAEIMAPSSERQPQPAEADIAPARANPVDYGPARERSASTSSSDSEQIVFAGRSKSSQTSDVGRSKPVQKVYQATVEDLEEPHIASAEQPSSKARSIPLGHARPNISTFEPSSLDRRFNRARTRRNGRRRTQEVSDEEEAIMQDYIANMAMYDSDEAEETTSKPVRKNEHYRFFDGSGEEHMKVQVQSSTPQSHLVTLDAHDLDQAMDWNSDDLEIFDNVSTSEEDIDDVTQVLRQRTRTNGEQYLVTSKGRTMDDAKWILSERLTSESAVREIQIFHEILALDLEEETLDEDDSDNSSEDEALQDLVDNIESEDDENARILAHASKMTDEQIARALAKQEELGIGGDELVLFNGDVGRSTDDLDDFENGDDFIAFSSRRHTSNRTRSNRNKKQRDSFPSAEAFADALDQDPYGAFDVMDFDRPSLRPRKKGRKSSGYPFDIELEDDELKDQLVSTWTKDREKKAQRKKDREEARQAAIYDASERGDPVVIKAEIRRFLCQEIEVLKLAPMESHVRASVHRLAKALRLNSHSEGKDGKGVGRFPVLTKTHRTPSYSIDNIWEVDALMNTRKFFPKHGGSYKTKSAATARAAVARTRRSGGVQGASYMNGEVVGASAPELGSDNKGRAMLEKMGWSSGMGIGAEGNKGSLEAIKHVFKTSKAGLG